MITPLSSVLRTSPAGDSIITSFSSTENIPSRQEEQHNASRMSRQSQKNVQYAVNSFLGKAANGTLSDSEGPIAAALGVHQAQKYFQVCLRLGLCSILGVLQEIDIFHKEINYLLAQNQLKMAQYQ